MKCQARTHSVPDTDSAKDRGISAYARGSDATEESHAFQVEEHLSHGLALHLQGKPRAALSEYRQALDLDANDSYGRYLAGLALMAMGCDRKAQEEWFVARTLRPQDEDSVWGIAMAKKLLDSNY